MEKEEGGLEQLMESFFEVARSCLSPMVNHLLKWYKRETEVLSSSNRNAVDGKLLVSGSQ